MSTLQIWYWGILLLIQVQVGCFASKWQEICEKMLVTRYKIMEKPSKVHRELCRHYNSIEYELKQQLLFDLPCQVLIKWRNAAKDWNFWCEAPNPRFPPRYYQMELSCTLRFLKSSYNLDKIVWNFKR